MVLNEKILKSLLAIAVKGERWSTIPEFDNYLVSDQGYVFSLNTCSIIKLEPTDKGYLRAVLRNEDGVKKVRIHRLVAEAFVPNPDGKVQVDHIDAIKQNNHYKNLRYCTNAENQIAAVKKGAAKTNSNKQQQYRLRKKTEDFLEKSALLDKEREDKLKHIEE